MLVEKMHDFLQNPMAFTKNVEGALIFAGIIYTRTFLLRSFL